MIESILSIIKPIALPISWALIHSLWQGIIIAGILAAALFIFKSADSKFRYALAAGAMIILLSTTITTFAIISGEQHGQSRLSSPLASDNHPLSMQIIPNARYPLDNVTAYAVGLPIIYIPLNNWIFIFWIMGVSAISFYNLMGWRRTRYLVSKYVSPVTEFWQIKFNLLCHKFNISEQVKIIQSKFVQAPCLIGWLKPTILVPAGALTGLNPKYLEMILAHELAHLKHYDILINYLQIFIETLLFFNPAVWWISRQIRAEREHRCDDFAVAKLGDPVQYAHALTELENFRFARAGLMMASDGGSLMHRIKRLLGRQNVSKNHKGIGAAIVAAASLLIIVGTCALSVTNINTAYATTPLPDGVVIPPDNYDHRGTWDAEWYGDEVIFRLYFRSHGSNSMNAWADELAGIEKAAETRFMLSRDAGTFYFDGGFDKIGNESLGSGNCYFISNPEYFKELAKIGFSDSFLGIDLNSKKEILQMAISNLSYQYAREMKDLGFGNLSLDRLIKLFNHGVNPKYIKELAEAGYEDLDDEQLQKMRDHGVDADYIRELTVLGYNKKKLLPAELVKFRDHGVDGAFVASLARHGYDDLTLEEVRKMRDHGVDDYYISAMVEYGYDDLSAAELVKLRDHGVTPSFIEELNTAGYRGLPASTLRKMKDHGVDGYFISSLQRYDYKDLSTSILIKMRDHGVDPYYISSLIDLGYCCIDPSVLIKMKDHGVSPEFIERANDDYGRKLEPNRLIRMKDRGY